MPKKQKVASVKKRGGEIKDFTDNGITSILNNRLSSTFNTQNYRDADFLMAATDPKLREQIYRLMNAYRLYNETYTASSYPTYSVKNYDIDKKYLRIEVARRSSYSVSYYYIPLNFLRYITPSINITVEYIPYIYEYNEEYLLNLNKYIDRNKDKIIENYNTNHKNQMYNLYTKAIYPSFLDSLVKYFELYPELIQDFIENNPNFKEKLEEVDSYTKETNDNILNSDEFITILNKNPELKKYLGIEEQESSLSPPLSESPSEPPSGGSRKSLNKCTCAELKEKCKARKIKGYSTMNKDQLIAALRRKK